MSEPIKLPPDVVTSRLVMEGINKHVGRDIEQWVNEQLRLAVEQATAELRAEVEKLRAAELKTVLPDEPTEEILRAMHTAYWGRRAHHQMLSDDVRAMKDVYASLKERNRNERADQAT